MNFENDIHLTHDSKNTKSEQSEKNDELDDILPVTVTPASKPTNSNELHVLNDIMKFGIIIGIRSITTVKLFHKRLDHFKIFLVGLDFNASFGQGQKLLICCRRST